jgi:hypothetical protein
MRRGIPRGASLGGPVSKPKHDNTPRNKTITSKGLDRLCQVSMFQFGGQAYM